MNLDRQHQPGQTFPGNNADIGFFSFKDKDNIAINSLPYEQTILELFLSPELYQGQRVLFTGMFLHDDQLKQYFGGRDTAVFRFLINCCAADALPLAIALDSGHANRFSNDHWVQVEGIFEVYHIDGNPVPLVKEAMIKPIEPPVFPYLF